jgi:hypothetical protein
MLSNEKYSDVLATIWEQMSTHSSEFNADNTFLLICNILQFIEQHQQCADLVTYHNINMIVEQLIHLILDSRKIKYDLEELRNTLKEAMRLYKSRLLANNLQKSRKKNCFGF